MKVSFYSIRLVLTGAMLSAFFAGKAQTITTIAGGLGNGGAAVAVAQMHLPESVCSDPAGNIYVADARNYCIRKILPAGTNTIYAGVGYLGYSGDGAAATNAKISRPSDICMDAAGNLYIADMDNNVVRVVTAAGIISTFAGNGSAGFSGDGFAATAAKLKTPTSVKADPAGNVYISDAGNSRIRAVNTSGNITTICGNGTPGYSGDGGPATSARISAITYLAPDATGNVYFSDQNRIRKVSTSGMVSRIAGDTASGYFGNGGPATAALLNAPKRLGFDGSGNLYIADSGNFVVRMISATGIISTLAGNHIAGYSGDGASATTAGLLDVQGVCADVAGNVFIADATDGRIRKINTTNIISTFAGQGNYGGDGGMATNCTLYGPSSASADAKGNVYIADRNNHCIRKIDTFGIITTIAGNGLQGYSGDHGPATAARLDSPMAVALNSLGQLLISDMGNNVIRMIDTAGIITTIAGTGVAGYTGDGAAAATATLNHPNGIKIDNLDNLYIADGNNNAVRKISASGGITTVAGNGSAGYSGDGGLASGASINRPSGVAWDVHNNLYISDWGNSAIRKINASGVISTIVGGVAGYSGDGGLASGASINRPAGVALDTFGNMFIADDGNNVIRRITAAGYISTVAGNGSVIYNGDGGPATAASVSAWRVSVDNSCHLYIADGLNNRIRKVGYAPIVTGISELTASDAFASVFPNPADEYFNVLIPGKWNSATITVVDMMGKAVMIRNVQNTLSTNITIGTSSLPIGSYLVRIETEGNTMRSKLSVMR